jgi:23S rRNA pseudouridine2605 synthase
MKKKTQPESAEPVVEIILPAKKSRAHETEDRDEQIVPAAKARKSTASRAPKAEKPAAPKAKKAVPAKAAKAAPVKAAPAKAAKAAAVKAVKPRVSRKKETAGEPIELEIVPEFEVKPMAEAAPEVEEETEVDFLLEDGDDEELSAEDAVLAKEDEDSEEEEEDELPVVEKPRAEKPAPKLERLQKILSQAGIASRRHAEEMILAGRVQVNGQVITTLGAKADAGQDHIRVDNKLLQGAERHRYFMLNKPKGFVTTVSDPEGRPTVMQFFEKMGERLYPVGRLDYLSEGLLLVTNDGELANLLTKAGSGVEKTYLVKVSGQPTEEELETLRAGVAIERGKEGTQKVRTAPARIRQVREGDNPWFEVVLIEGRNRELRKMFSAIGHFVEKIRRVGYGPLILDMEPGKLRELEGSEVEELRLTAIGKLKPRRFKVARLLPKDAGRTVIDPKDRRAGKPYVRGASPYRPSSDRPSSDRPQRREGGYGARGDFKPRTSGPRYDRPATGRPSTGDRPAYNRPAPAGGEETGRSFSRPPAKPYGQKPFGQKPPYRSGSKPGFDRAAGGDRPAYRRPAPEGGEEAGRSSSRPPSRPYGQKPFGQKPPFRSGPRPGFDRAAGGDRPAYNRPAPAGGEESGRSSSRPPSRPYGQKPFGQKPPYRSGSKPGFDRAASGDRPTYRRPAPEGGEEPRRSFSRPAGRPFEKKPYERKPFGDRPRPSGDRPEGARPPRAEGSAPAYRSNSRPSAGGDRKPGFASKPKFGGSGSGRPKSAGSRPGRPKSSFKGKPGAPKRPGSRSGPRPGGKRP